MNTKVISLIVTILGIVITAAAAVSGAVSPQWGLVIGAAVAIAYGVERTLQKILAGASLKSLLTTTEAWGTALVLLASLGTAITGVVPPAVAVTVAAVAAIMLRFGRALQGGASVVPAASTTVKALVLFLLAGSLFAGCAWWQKHEQQIDCAAIAAVEDAPLLISIVTQCEEIAVDLAAVLPCIQGAAGSKWTNDVMSCFYAASQGKTACPAFAKAKATMDAKKR